MPTGPEKVNFHSNPKERQCQRNVQTTVQLYSFHRLARLCSKSFRLGFSSMWTENFQKYKLNSENSSFLEKVSFHSSPKEGKCQRIFQRQGSLMWLQFMVSQRVVYFWVTEQMYSMWNQRLSRPYAPYTFCLANM